VGLEEGKAPIPGERGDTPRFIQKGGKPPTLAVGPRVGPKAMANPEPTRVGENRGMQGAMPPAGGNWGGAPPGIPQDQGGVPQVLSKKVRYLNLACPSTTPTDKTKAHGKP